MKFKTFLVVSLLAGAPSAAFAQGFDLFGFGGNGHHSHSAPAPLLAAGVPAFLAVGGGAAFMRLMRRLNGTARTKAE